MSAPENPSAFACAWYDQNEHGVRFPMINPGMSLRDYFAGQWLAGLAADGVAASAEEYAEEAYQIADAMLAERAKTGGQS